MAPMNHRLMRPRARGGFDPKSISGLLFWLDGNAGVFDADSGGSACTNGSAVGRWEDRSGNGNHFVQSDGNNRPTYTTAALNGNAILDFDGDNDRLTRALGTTYAQPHTIVVVASADNSAAGQIHLFDSNPNRAAVFKAINTATGSLFAGTVLSSTSANVWTSGTYRVVVALFNGASSAQWVSGTQSQTGNAGSQSLGSTVAIGADIGASVASPTRFWQGNVAEVIAYSKALSESERQSLQTYLGKKYNITIS